MERLVQQFHVFDLWFTPAIRLQQAINGTLRFRLGHTHHDKDCVLCVGNISWIRSVSTSGTQCCPYRQSLGAYSEKLFPWHSTAMVADYNL